MSLKYQTRFGPGELRKLTLSGTFSALLGKFAWQGVLRHLRKIARNNAETSVDARMKVAWSVVEDNLMSSERILLKARDLA